MFFSKLALMYISTLSRVFLLENKWAVSWENQFFNVTAKLISAFVFATWIVQYLYFLNTKFQASSHLQ